MNFIGATLGFIVVLLIGGPFIAVVGFFALPNSDLLRFLSDVASQLLVGFLIIYVYAVISSYLYTFVLSLITLIPAGLLRSIMIWLLCVLYLTGTAIFLLSGLPLLLALYFGAVVITSGLVVTQSIFGLAWLALLFSTPLHFLIVLIAYILADAFAPVAASITAATANTTTSTERTWRGLMIGVNAAMNLLLATVISGTVLVYFIGVGAALFAGLSIGLVLAIINFSSALMPTPSQGANTALRFILGWMSWLMPMNWLTITLGWVTYLLNMLSHTLFGLPYHSWSGFFSIQEGRIDISTGTMYVEGGIASNLWLNDPLGPVGASGAYNLGCFANVHARTSLLPTPLVGITLGPASAISLNVTQHESGHNLNLLAFGSYFHLINAVDENIAPFTRGIESYAERLAESNVASTTANVEFNRLPIWRI